MSNYVADGDYYEGDNFERCPKCGELYFPDDWEIEVEDFDPVRMVLRMYPVCSCGCKIKKFYKFSKINAYDNDVSYYK